MVLSRSRTWLRWTGRRSTSIGPNGPNAGIAAWSGELHAWLHTSTADLNPRTHMSFLTLKGISKHYGDFTAIEHIDLDVERGEFLSLLGPSGCGKTTTLQMIAGFVEPSAGTINLGGSDLTKIKPAARGLGIVFQSYALFPHMTASENIAFGLEMRGVAKAEQTSRVTDVLSLVGLAGFSDRYPRRMSGGQQQRVA